MNSTVITKRKPNATVYKFCTYFDIFTLIKSKHSLLTKLKITKTLFDPGIRIGANIVVLGVDAVIVAIAIARFS